MKSVQVRNRGKEVRVGRKCRHLSVLALLIAWFGLGGLLFLLGQVAAAQPLAQELSPQVQVPPPPPAINAPDPDMAVSKQASADPVTAGQSLTYTIVITNGGPDDATGVLVTDTLSAVVGLRSVAPSQGACAGTGPIVCSLGALSNTLTATITLVVTPTVAGPLTNTAVITCNEGDIDLSNNTASVGSTVSPADLDHIVIEDAAGGLGSEVLTRTLTAGQMLPVWAAGYDRFGNYVGDVSVDWTGTGVASGYLWPTSGASTTFFAIVAGQGTITADDGSGHQDSTETVTVNPGPLQAIVIEDAAGGLGDEVLTRYITAGHSLSVWAAGYDQYGNYRGDVTSNWSGIGVVEGNLTPTLGISTTFASSLAGGGSIQADDGSGHQDSIGGVIVAPADPEEIVIRDAPGGQGSEVLTRTLTAGESLTVWAAGYDPYTNYWGDVLVSWSGTGVISGVLTPAFGVSTTLSAAAAGRGIIQADDGSGHLDSTGTITVTAADLDHIVIEDAPDGTGSELLTRTLEAGDSLTVWAASYDLYENYLGDLPVSWSGTGVVSGSLAPSNGISTTFLAMAAGTGTVEADDGAGHSDGSGIITVTAADLDHILIEDAAGGIGGEVLTRTLTAGQDLSVWAAGYDQYGNFWGDVSVDWSGSGVLAGRLTPTLGISTTTAAVEAGVGAIGADDGAGHSDSTGLITVTVADLDHIVIEDAAGGAGGEVLTRTLTAGESLTVWAAAYDQYGNYRGDLSVSWSGIGVVLGHLTPTLGISATFVAVEAGTGAIGADDGAGHADSTGSITVTAAALHHIIVEDAAGGAGSEVLTRTLTAGESLTVWAAAYDQYGNYRGDLAVSWSGTGAAAGHLNPTAGVSTTFSTTGTGAGTIAADDGSGHLDSTGVITVVPADLDHIVIEDAAGGLGGEVLSPTLSAGIGFPVWAAGYDQHGNYWGDVSVGWSGTGVVAGQLSPTTGVSTTFSPAAAGQGSIAADDGSGRLDSTGTITVIPGDLGLIVIEDTAGGAGSEVLDRVMEAGDSLTVWAAGYDDYDNYRGDVSVSWSGIGAVSGHLAPTVGVSTTFSASTMGLGAIVANDGSGHTDATGTITVTAGSLSYILVEDAPGGVGSELLTRTLTAGDSLTVWAASYDEFGNYRGDISVDWSGSGVASGRMFPLAGTHSTLSATIAGQGSIQADDGNGHSAEGGPVIVLPAGLDHLGLSAIDSPQVAGQPFTMTVSALDRFGNVVSAYSGYASLSDATGTLSPAATGSFVSGIWTGQVTVEQAWSGDVITAADGSYLGSSNPFDVGPGPLDHFSFGTVAAQVAGQPFIVTITALDAYGNQVTTFSGSATLTDTTHTIDPTATGSFVGGLWSGSVTITGASSSVRITAADGEASGTSNSFIVGPAALHHFSFAPIPSPQTAGQPFTLTITARDAYSNIVSSFVGPATLTDTTATIDPLATGSFSGGIWTGPVSIFRAQEEVTITAGGGGVSGDSNSFEVDPNDPALFGFDPIAAQTAGQPFTVTITALDSYGNLVRSYAGPVALSDSTGTITPTTVTLDRGIWIGPAVITQAGSGVSITASDGEISGGSNNFVVSPGELAFFVFDPIPSPQTAGEVFSVTIRAYDLYDNLKTNYAGPATLTDTTGTVNPALTGSFGDGEWAGGLSVSLAQGGVQLGVRDGDAFGNSNLFDVVPGALSHFVFSAVPSPQTAGGPFSVTITAQDAQGNTVTSFGDSVTLTDTTRTISPTATGNFSSGQWQGELAITQAGNGIVITAWYQALSGSSNSFNVRAGSLDHFSIGPVFSPQIAGQPFVLTITAQDPYNNTVTTYAASATLTDTTGTISPLVTGNFVGGVWTGSVTVTRAQTLVTVSAADGTISGESNGFEVAPAALDHFEWAPVGDQTAGQPFSVTITARDAYANLVTGYTDPVALSDTTGTIDPVLSGSFSGGSWTGSVSITQAGAAIVISAAGGGASGDSNSFAVSPAALHHFAVASVGSPQTAGQNFDLTLTAQDEYGNTRAAYTGPADLSDTTGTISPTQTGPFLAGQWTGSVRITQAGLGVSILASDGGISGSSNSFEVVPGALDYFAFAPVASPQTAGVPFQVRIRAYDAYDNFKTNYTGAAAISDSTGSISPTLTGNFAGGLWVGDFTITLAQSGVTIIATDGAASGGSNSFAVQPAGLDHFAFDPIGGQTAGHSFFITIRARDAFENLVSNYGGAVVLTDTTGTISPTTTGGFAGGLWTGAVTILQEQSGVRITAQDGGIQGTSNSFNVNPGDLDHFVLSPLSSPQTAGQPFTVTVTARDPFDNIVSAYVGPANLADASSTLEPGVTGPFTGGVWTGWLTITQAIAGDLITVTDGSAVGSSNSFDVNPGDLDHLTLAPIADQTAGQPFSVTITAQDLYQNQVTTYTGTATLTDGSGSISPTATTSFAAGLWSGAVVITRTWTGVVITAADGAVSGQSNGFDVRPGVLHHFEFALLQDQTAGQPFTVTVRAYDEENNLKTDYAGPAQLADSTGTIVPASTGSFAGGVWTGLVTIVQAADQVVITATDGVASGSSNSFDVFPGLVHHFLIAPISSPQTAGQPFTLTVTAQDVNSNTVSGYLGPAALSDSTGTLDPAQTGVFSAGVWIGPVTITQTGTALIITVSDGAAAGSSNSFQVQADQLHHFTFAAVPSPQVAGQSFVLSLQAEDLYGNVVSSFSDLVQLSDPTGTLFPAETGNFSQGLWSGTAQITRTWTGAQITAQNGVITGTSNSFDIGPGALDHFSFLPIPSPVTAGQPFTVTIQAFDAYDNLQVDYGGMAALADSTGTIAPLQTGSFAGGSWSGAVTITQAQDQVVITASDGSASGQSNPLNVVPAGLHHFRFATVPSPQTAGQLFQITLTAQDLYNNTLGDYAGTAFMFDSTGTIVPTATTPFSGGVWTGSVSITRTGTSVVITAFDGSASGTSNSFTVRPAALDHFLLANVSSPQTAGQPFSLTVRAFDVYDNLKTNYSGVADLQDPTGTLAPSQTGSFGSGEWVGEVTITRAQSQVQITAADGAASGVTNLFDVLPAALHHFAFAVIPSPQTAGQPFQLSLTAQDAYGNRVTGYSGSAALADTTGTISPDQTGNFNSGAWAGSVQITQSQAAVIIAALDGNISGNSNSFNVVPAAVDTIVVSPDSAVIGAGTVQTYTAEAFDALGNSRGDVTASTGFQIVEPGHQGYWVDNHYYSARFGEWTVRGAFTGTGVISDTTLLTVLGPFMQIDKRAHADIVDAGDLLSYTLTYSNTGNLLANTVLITDQLDPNTTFFSASPSPAGGLPGAPYWSIGSLDPGEVRQITLTVEVGRPLPNGTRLTNRALVAAEGLAAVMSSEETLVRSSPVLSIVKSDDPDPVIPGHNLIYTIIITNSGNETASFVTVREYYDPNTSFIYANPPPAPGTDNREWRYSYLPVDESRTINVVVLVHSPLLPGTVLTNGVTLDSLETSSIAYTERTLVTAASELSISKVDAPDPVPAGSDLAYFISYQNSGTADAVGVIITETYDSRVSFISANPPPAAGTDNVWDIGFLPVGGNGSILVTVHVEQPLPDHSLLTNLVTIDSDFTEPSSYTETTTVTSAPELSFGVRDWPDPVQAGAMLTYTLAYTNSGNANATQVLVTATLDGQVAFAGADPAPAGGGGQVWYWLLSEIQGVAGTGEILLYAEVALPLPDGTQLELAAQLADAEGDYLVDAVQTTVASAPELSFAKSDGRETVLAGDLLTYTLTYTNSGNENGYDLLLTDTLPSYVDYVSCAIPDGSCQFIAPDRVVYELPFLPAPTNGEAQLVVQVHDPLPAGALWVINHARMTAPSLPVPIDIQDADRIATLPDLVIAAQHEPLLFSPGRLMHYTLAFSNTGHMDAEGVLITTLLPTDTLYMGDGWTTTDGEVYSYTVGALPAASLSLVVTFTVRYTDQVQIGQIAFDTPFTIQGAGGLNQDAQPDDNIARVQIGVPDLAVINFTVAPLPLVPNHPVTFTIVMENQGTGWALNPDNLGGFWTDVFTASVPSYPFDRYGEIYGGPPPLAPGARFTLTLIHDGFSPAQVARGIDAFYVKLDNDGTYPYGLVPEFNELNNVAGPIDPHPGLSYRLYLPLVARQ